MKNRKVGLPVISFKEDTVTSDSNKVISPKDKRVVVLAKSRDYHCENWHKASFDEIACTSDTELIENHSITRFKSILRAMKQNKIKANLYRISKHNHNQLEINKKKVNKLVEMFSK